MSAICVKQTQNQERAVSWATWLKTEFRGHLVHPRPPTFCSFQASHSPNETPRPPYQWSLGGARGHGGGQQWVHQGPRGGKNQFFSKFVPRPVGMLQQVFLARFELVVTRFGPCEIPKCLENGPFWDQKWVQNGSKMGFPQGHLGPFMMLKQVFLAHFEPMVTRFGHGKSQNALTRGRFGTKNGRKTRQKCVFPKVTLDHWGCTNK